MITRCKKVQIVFALLALMVMILSPVQAQTITMANPGGVAERDIMVYYPNGTMQGFYNSTSVITLDSESDYIFTMKPLSTNPLEDPGDWLDTGFTFIQSNTIPLIIGLFLLGIFFARWR